MTKTLQEHHREPAFAEPAHAAQSNAAPPEEPQQIEEEIECIRDELGELIGELDRRRHALTNVPLQMRRHPLAVALLCGAAVLAVGSLTTWIYRRARPDPLQLRARKLAHALALVSRDPDRLLDAMERRPDPRVTLLSALSRIAGAAGTQAVRRAL